MAQMPKFLEDYTTVDELISKMNKEYPESRLISEMVGYGDDWVIFKSSFYETKEDAEPKAVAYAKQTSKDHNSWFEMANTKANGRTLRIVFSTNQDLDKARAFTAQALGAMNMSKTEVSFANMQSVKNKIQDIATEARTHVDKGE